MLCIKGFILLRLIATQEQKLILHILTAQGQSILYIFDNCLIISSIKLSFCSSNNIQSYSTYYACYVSLTMLNLDLRGCVGQICLPNKYVFLFISVLFFLFLILKL